VIQKPDELLNKLTETRDLYFISMLILYLCKEEGRYSTIAELAYLLDPKSFLNLMWYYEGQVIRIPTKAELDEILSIILAYYYYDIKKLPWDQVLQKIGVEHTPSNSRHIKTKLVWLRRTLEKAKLPENLKDMNTKT